MFLTTTKRVIKSGFVQFWRGTFVSLSSILVMFITLSVIASLLFLSVIFNAALTEIKDKVDINIYFSANASEEEVLAAKAVIEKLPEVAAANYIPKEQVLAAFKDRHQNDSTILLSLEEIGENPLGAIINVKAKDPNQYEAIYNDLNNQSFLSKDGISIIDKINYVDTKSAIDKLTKFIRAGERLGLIFTCIMISLSIIITFNTIRLAIYISREEIAVMRLVGASNKYIRGPFVVIGIIYGVFAGILTLAVAYPVTYWIGNLTVNFLSGVSIHAYYISHFPQIFVLIISSGIILGAVSSYLAVRKYLTN